MVYFAKMSNAGGRGSGDALLVRVYSGDVRALSLRPHQALVSCDVSLPSMAIVRLQHGGNGSKDSCLLEMIRDRRDPSNGGLAAGCIQVHQWVADAIGIYEGASASMQKVLERQEIKKLVLSVVERSPPAVRISSTPTASTSHSDSSMSAAAMATLLPESIRSGLVDLNAAIRRQVQAMYPYQRLHQGDLIPIQLMGETFVFRVIEAAIVEEYGTASCSDEEEAMEIDVLGLKGSENATDITSLSTKLNSLTLEATNNDHIGSRLGASGFDGYTSFIQDVLFHILLNFASSTSTSSLVCHGVLIRGVPGVGKTQALRVISEELQYRGVSSVWRIDGMSLLMEYENSKVASAYDFLLDRFEQFLPAFTRQRRGGAGRAVGVVLIDDIEVLFKPANASQDTGDDTALMPLGSALLRFLDSLTDTSGSGPQRVCIVATTSVGGDDSGDDDSGESIPPIAKRSGRFDKQIEMIVPTEAMRRAMLTLILGTVPLEDSAVDAAIRLAELTGGYVAKDLVRIVRLAYLQANVASRDSGRVVVTWDHLVEAQRQIKPSQLRQLNVASPSIDAAFVSPFAGYVHLQQQLSDFITWKFHPSAAMKLLGVANASGLLIHGPSGCGKSLLVKTLAAKAKVNFVSIKSSELLSKYFGDSERAVRQLFARARAAAPCLLFFDEFDAIAHKRSFGDANTNAGDGTGVYARILSTFLNEMDGVGAARHRTADVLVVAATNRLDALDAALIRPGRIDKCVELAYPENQDCLAILEHYTQRMPLAADVDLASLAHQFARTPQFSGADIAAVSKEAALRALRESIDADAVTLRHFLAAFHQRTGSRQLLDNNYN